MMNYRRRQCNQTTVRPKTLRTHQTITALVHRQPQLQQSLLNQMTRMAVLATVKSLEYQHPNPMKKNHSTGRRG